MPQVILNFTTDQAARSLAATVGLHPKPDIDTDNPATGQPWTDQQWWKRCLIVHLKDDVRKWERAVAVNDAVSTLDQDPDIAT